MTIKQPEVNINIVGAGVTVQNTPHKVLIVGQKNSGTATAGALVEQIQNDKSEDGLFGEDSMLAAMIRAFKKTNQETRIDAIGLDDDGGASNATGQIAITGTATQVGSLQIFIGSRENHAFTVTVADTDTAAAIATAIDAALGADAKLPVTSAPTSGDVDLTAVNAGPDGNDIGIWVVGAIAGISVALTAMTGGAGAPSTTSLFDAIDGERYQTIVYPDGWLLDDLKDELDARFNTNNDVLDGVGIIGIVDSFSNIQAKANALNSQSLALLAFKEESETLFKGSALFELPTVTAALLAAVRALRLTDGSNIAQFTIATNGARDSFGGAALASFPYFNTPFPELPLIPTGLGWTTIEIEDLLTAGAGTISNNRAANTVIAGELPTTYKTDAAANPDPSFKFLNFVDTISGVREFMVNNLRARFAQSRLTEGDLVPNRSIANAAVIESFLDGLYTELSGADFVLTQAGEAALQFFKTNRSIELDLSEGKVTVTMKVPIVTQLRKIEATIQLAFSTSG